jgi:hypothetical protein
MEQRTVKKFCISIPQVQPLNSGALPIESFFFLAEPGKEFGFIPF